MNYSPHRNATLTGVLTSIGNIGGIVASSPLALLALALGWRETFLIIFSVMFLFVVVAWFSVKDPENKPILTSKSSIKDDLKKIFSNRQLLLIIPAPFFVYGCFVSFQGLWAGPFLLNVYGMSKAAASLSFMFISIGFVFAFPLAGFISDKIGKKKPVLLTGISLTLLFWLVMTFFGGSFDSYQLIALFTFLGFSYGVACIFLTIPVTLFPLEISGSAIASLNIFNFIGGGFFQFLMGAIIDATSQPGNGFISYQIIFIVAALGALLSLICAIFFKEQKRTENKAIF